MNTFQEELHKSLVVRNNGLDADSIQAQLLGSKRPRTEPDIWLTPKEAQIIGTLKAVIHHYKLDVTPRIAGGWVRDKLLGLASDDIDIALDTMLGEELAQHVQNYLAQQDDSSACSSVGVIRSNPAQSKHLNTATFKLHGQSVDMNNLRTEFYDTDSRIPIATIGTTRDDALRRDFTANSMYFNIMTGRIEDIVGTGISDLTNGILRTPLPAFKTFNDDPLRVLRCARFAGRFGFQVTKEIERASAHPSVHRNLLTKVSRERLGIEMMKMFHEFGRVPATIALISRWGLRTIVLDYPAPLTGQVAHEINNGTSALLGRPSQGQGKKAKLTPEQLAEQNAARCPNLFLSAKHIRTFPYFPLIDAQYLIVDELKQGGRAVVKRVNLDSPFAKSLTTSSLIRLEDPILTQTCWSLLFGVHKWLVTKYPHQRPVRLTKADVLKENRPAPPATEPDGDAQAADVSKPTASQTERKEANPCEALRQLIITMLENDADLPKSASLRRAIKTLSSTSNRVMERWEAMDYLDNQADVIACLVNYVRTAHNTPPNNQLSEGETKEHKVCPRVQEDAATKQPGLDDMQLALLASYVVPFVGYETYHKDSKSKLRPLIHQFVLESLKRSLYEAETTTLFAEFAVKINKLAYELFIAAMELCDRIKGSCEVKDKDSHISAIELMNEDLERLGGERSDPHSSSISKLRSRVLVRMCEVCDLISSMGAERLHLAFDLAEAIAFTMHDQQAPADVCLPSRSIRSLSTMRTDLVSRCIEAQRIAMQLGAKGAIQTQPQSAEIEELTNRITTAEIAAAFAFPTDSTQSVTNTVQSNVMGALSVSANEQATCKHNPEPNSVPVSRQSLLERVFATIRREPANVTSASDDAAPTQTVLPSHDDISACSSRFFNPYCIKLLREFVTVLGLSNVLFDQPLLNGGEIEARYPGVLSLNELVDEVRAFRLTIPWASKEEALVHLDLVFNRLHSPMSIKLQEGSFRAPPAFVKPEPEGNFTFVLPWQHKTSSDGMQNEKWSLGASQANAGEFAQAFESFKAAAEANDSNAQCALGTMFLLGKGVERDYTQGRQWLARAAKQRDPIALCNLGVCCIHGFGGPVNWQLAVKLFKAASSDATGCASAYTFLGLCYQFGAGVEEDPERALEMFNIAASQDDANAHYNLGRLLIEQSANDQSREHKAIEHLSSAAQKGHPQANLLLGYYYEKQGTDADRIAHAKAFEHYSRAAETYAEGKRQLGHCFEHGIGTVRDEGKALSNYGAAARLGDAQAQLAYGRASLAKGSLKEGYDWLSKAARQGIPQAQLEVARCLRDGKGAGVNLLQATKWYLKAAEQGLAEAQFELGECYEQGKGVEPDQAIARKWYTLAANQGHQPALQKLA